VSTYAPTPLELEGGPAELGESPVWDERSQRLLFVDIRAGAIRSFEPASGAEERFELATTVGCVVLDESGAVIVAAGTRILRILEGGTEVLATTGDGPEIRFNDGSCDSRGRLWAGTMADDEGPGKGSLYRLDERGLERVHSPVSISNGIDWSLDGRTMYYVDSTDHRVYAFGFDAETGELDGQRTFVELEEADGFPDGLTVDAEGCLWLAIWDGWRVLRYGPDGSLRGELQLPVARPTSCAFGGTDLGELFITSANTHLSGAELAAQPHAGAVFSIRPGVVGRVANRFCG
jgi:sugar lactone lactonase YvrE